MSDDCILVKLRPSSALRAVSRTNLRPLYQAPREEAEPLGLAAAPRWYVAELPEGAATPWDLAHAQVAEQLGVTEGEVLFAEPDLVHEYPDPMQLAVDEHFAVEGDHCKDIKQDGSHGKKLGPNTFAWHLGKRYSQLGEARAAVSFSEPRTRIAHIDTGYDRGHVTRPGNIVTSLERNFVEGDDPGSAQDPDNDVWVMDNSGHGTGTIGILAGGQAPGTDTVLGGAPEAEVLPLRVADRVVLIRTSALAEAFEYATTHRCDVVTLSMGGLPTAVWNEKAYNAYLAGVCIVAAAGNNAKGLPTRNMVYPARYGCVIAACGVMADGSPYVGLEGGTLQGNYGPDSRMKSAVAAYTPNIPWALFGCEKAIRRNGEGTSAATPQVAAAVALWFEKYKKQLPRSWKRVEAVRHALFLSAKGKTRHKKKFGNGILQANVALAVKPALGLKQTKKDSNWFPFLRVLTGLGLTEPTPREEMFNLELMQRLLLNAELAKIVPDPDEIGELSRSRLRKLMETVIEDDKASVALREHVRERYPVLTNRTAPSAKTIEGKAPEEYVIEAPETVTKPPYRRIRVYAVDPSQSTRLDTAASNELTLEVRWEELGRGPKGEYLEVVDTDASGPKHEPVDLDDPLLLAQDGWAPSEGNPQFHQQMVYAVAMKTIAHFERALGRPVLWRHKVVRQRPRDDSGYRQRLRIRPHALRQANAFYSPRDGALLFGYFEARADDPGHHLPRGRVYTCLSHDIVAHETTHAILDGMHRRFNEPTNPDVLALHEGFADIIALLQHYTIPTLLENEIARTRGDLEAQSMLGSLALQMGHAMGGRSALRDAIGSLENGAWKRRDPDPAELDRTKTPHARGSILVAAVFDAFIAIHTVRTADLFRIYTGGTGVLRPGAIHPDLVGRIAGEAAKSANHVLNMCIRALDYLPPVDVTFGEYLRALITADFDLVADDRYNYRVAFIDAFRRRGIYPDDVETLSVDTLRWQGRDFSSLPKKEQAAALEQYEAIAEDLREYADACLYITDREELFRVTREQRKALHAKLTQAFRLAPSLAEWLGLEAGRRFEVHELRRAGRVGPDGRHVPQLVLALLQAKYMKDEGAPGRLFRGGSTLVVDLVKGVVKYRIVKRINSARRMKRVAKFHRDAAEDPLRALLLGPMDEGDHEPFSVLHSVAEQVS